MGEEFLRVFYAAAGEIRSMPQRFPKVTLEIHRCLLRRFPYAIYFTCATELITVIGLFHCVRDPGISHDPLEARGDTERDA